MEYRREGWPVVDTYHFIPHPEMSDPPPFVARRSTGIRSIMRQFVEGGCPVNFDSEDTRSFFLSFKSRRRRDTVLHMCIRLQFWWSDSQRATALENMLKLGADVNALNRDGESPLWLALVRGMPMCVTTLLDHAPSKTLVPPRGAENEIQISSAEVAGVKSALAAVAGNPEYRPLLGDFVVYVLTREHVFADEVMRDVLVYDDVKGRCSAEFATFFEQEEEDANQLLAERLAGLRLPHIFKTVLEVISRVLPRGSARGVRFGSLVIRKIVALSYPGKLLRRDFSMMQDLFCTFGEEITAARDERGDQILHICKDENMVPVLLRAGARLEGRDARGLTCPARWLTLENGRVLIRVASKVLGLEEVDVMLEAVSDFLQIGARSRLDLRTYELCRAILNVVDLGKGRLHPEKLRSGVAGFFEIHEDVTLPELCRAANYIFDSNEQGAAKDILDSNKQAIKEVLGEIYLLFRCSRPGLDLDLQTLKMLARTTPKVLTVSDFLELEARAGDADDRRYVRDTFSSFVRDACGDFNERESELFIEELRPELLNASSISELLAVCSRFGSTSISRRALERVIENGLRKSEAWGERVNREVSRQMRNTRLRIFLREFGDHLDWMRKTTDEEACLVDRWASLSSKDFVLCLEALPRRGNFPARRSRAFVGLGESADDAGGPTLVQELWNRRILEVEAALAIFKRENTRELVSSDRLSSLPSSLLECCALADASDVPLCELKRLSTFIGPKSSWWRSLRKYDPEAVCAFLSDLYARSRLRKHVEPPFMNVPNFFGKNPTFPLVRNLEELWCALRFCFPSSTREEALRKLLAGEHLLPKQPTPESLEVTGAARLLEPASSTREEDEDEYQVVRRIWHSVLAGSGGKTCSILGNWRVWKRIVRAWLGVPEEFLQDSFLKRTALDLYRS
jgi:hypothetical protein